ncbi:DNA polymerase III subunit delta [Sphingomonas sp. NSE70-1]|uniref:DNA-directed DNA polymerase n=1 Tax=Sphingomonas caseinilyticus TaxID=2908205 RepID=A0ABT0RVF8_9SPHN|nr:DNA polymerase III subunit delta [Sphingomonas caseinilyticus]MCL6698791.1 DNA polymerase III subunit delta [Sphingomonas caseinilyticus]
MKIPKGGLAQALDRPDQDVRFYLFHGADEAGSRGLAERLLKGLGAEKSPLTGQAVKADPAMLADEAGAISLFGGKRAIWVEPAGDEIAEGVTALFELPASESPVIAVAGTLRKTSALLKLAEAHSAALSHIGYVPEGRDLERLVVDLGRDVGLRVTPELAQRVASASGGNQAVALQELSKFALYLGAERENPKELDPETVDLLGADCAEADLMRLGDLALLGRMRELLDELGRLPHGSSEAIPVLRALQRRLLMLAPLRSRIERGDSVDGVMTSMGKALFWKDKPLIQRLLSTWSSERLAEAASRVAQLERQIMLRPLADDAALGETLVTLARAAGRGR